MKQILLPLDAFKDSRPVLQAVLDFLEEVKGEFKICLLHTFMVTAASSGEVIQNHDNLRRLSLQRLENEAGIATDLLKKMEVNVTFETLSQIGTPANVIPRLVKERGIDCVILARNVTSKSEEIVALLNRLHCPAVILPSETI